MFSWKTESLQCIFPHVLANNPLVMFQITIFFSYSGAVSDLKACTYQFNLPNSTKHIILNWILAQIDPLQLLLYCMALVNCEWPCFYLRPDSASMICVTDATFTDFFFRIMTLRWASGRTGICNDQSQRCVLEKGGRSALEREKRKKMKRGREREKWLNDFRLKLGTSLV